MGDRGYPDEVYPFKFTKMLQISTNNLFIVANLIQAFHFLFVVSQKLFPPDRVVWEIVDGVFYSFFESSSQIEADSNGATVKEQDFVLRAR